MNPRGTHVAWLVAAALAAALPLGLLVPEPVLAHVAPLPSFDLLRPCTPPRPADPRLHALAPMLLLRALAPLGVLLMASRRRVRVEAPLGVAFAAATLLLLLSAARLARGGVELGAYRTCGALTPDDGAPIADVRRAVASVLGERRLDLLRFRAQPRLPRPPWAHAEIAVTIAREPYLLRPRRDTIAAEPDDPRRADRPLPALHLASVPTIVRGEGGDVILDPRPNGRVFAVRLGRPVTVRDVGWIARPPLWPFLLLAAALPLAALLTRVRRSGVASLILVEATATCAHVLAPYL